MPCSMDVHLEHVLACTILLAIKLSHSRVTCMMLPYVVCISDNMTCLVMTSSHKVLKVLEDFPPSPTPLLGSTTA